MIEQGDTELDALLREVFPMAGQRPLGGSNRVKLPGISVPGGGAGAGVGGRGGGGGGGGGGAPEPSDTSISLGNQPIAAIKNLLSHLMLHAAPPYHQAPPYMADAIDVFPTAAVSIAGGGYGGGSFTTIISYTVPESFNAVFTLAGQQAESAAAYQDMQWRIRRDQKAFRAYGNIRSQLFQQAPPGTVILIPVRGGQTIDVQAASLSATTYNVWARLMGWQWPTQFDEGESASGNIV